MRKFIIGCILIMSCTLLQAQKAQKDNSIAVLYDNDVHCYVEGYPIMAGLADSLRREGHPVIIVSCGDFIFGNTLGIASNGSYIVRLMNAVGYNYTTLGNHEFDYGLPQLQRLERRMKSRIICCNFVDNQGRSVMTKGILHKEGKTKIGFIGVTTPSSLTSSTPTFFQDADGHFIYSFCSKELSQVVQHVTDSLRAMGAQTIILLSHLGDTENGINSRDLISKTHGIDVVLDGHDHHTIAQQWVANEYGVPVILSSTGEYFNHIGILTITPFKGRDPMLSTQLLETRALKAVGCIRQSVADTLEAIWKQYDDSYRGVIARNPYKLTAFDATGMRQSRYEECNLGDFISDAYRIVSGAQIGWINGGSMRADLDTGDISFNELLSILPFQNNVVLAKVKGQDIINGLEMGCRTLPTPCGGFAQVSGLTYEVDLSIPSSVVVDSNGMFQQLGKTRRVKNIRLVTEEGSKPIDPEQYYTLASTNFILEKHGDGLVFEHVDIINEEVGSDIWVVQQYLKMMGGVVDIKYRNSHRRIIIK